MDSTHVKNIIEACLLVAGRAMSLRQIDELFVEDENRPDKETIKTCLEELKNDYEGRGIELVQVASGYRLQSRESMSPWVARLFPEKPPRYSRALLETLVLVAYRQPITRGEIEEIRGVAVSSNIVKTLQERQWVKEVGFKDVPGKPALLGTTKEFLDYFNLKRLDDLPPLSEIKNLEDMDSALVEAAGIAPENTVDAANDEGVHAGEDGDASDSNATSDISESADGNNQQDLEASQTEDGIEDGTEEQTTDKKEEGPLTFAGLISNLPRLEDTDVEASPPQTDDAENAEELSASDTPTTDDKDPATANEAQEALLSAVASFADEHRQDVEARDALESQLSTRNSNNDGGADDSDVSASSEEVLDVGSADSDSDADVAQAEEDSAKPVDTEFKEAELVEAESVEAELVKAESANKVSADHDDSGDDLGDVIDASSRSPDILSDTFTGDPPTAGETLH